MKKLQNVFILVFLGIFLASCATKSQEDAPKIALKDTNITLAPSRYTVVNKGKAPAKIDPFISQDARDLRIKYGYHIKLDENRFLERLFRVWDDKQIPKSKDAMWALKYFKTGFDENGKARSSKWFRAVRDNANAKAYASINQPAITIAPSLARNLPTNDVLYPSKKSASEQNFDNLQESVLASFAPVTIMHFSKDGKWAFVRTDAFYTFVESKNLMILNEQEQKNYKDFSFGVFIKEDVNISSSIAISRVNKADLMLAKLEKTSKSTKNTKTSNKKTKQAKQEQISKPTIANSFNANIQARIGGIFPYTSEDAHNFYFKGKIGGSELSFSVPKAVGSHFLVVNDKNLKMLANEFMNQGYGWGGQWFLRDCSLFTKDFYAVFGMWLPRNSQAQGKIGTHINLKGLNNKEKQIVLNTKALGLTSLLIMPGHVMIYAGDNEAVHNFWGIRTAQNGRSVAARTAITDLELGRGYDDISDKSLLLSRLNSATIIIDPRKIALEHAYGVRITGDKIRFNDGYTLSYNDTNASAVFDLPYPLYEPLNATLLDAGRSRPYKLFDHIYGANLKEVSDNLKEVIWLKGVYDKPLKFNAKNGAADALQRVSDELAMMAKKDTNLKKLLKDSGTFNYRKIADTNDLSAHAYAIAIDIAVDESTYWRWHKEYKNPLPAVIVDVFEKNGFIWGGRWEHFDTMHFEYRPEFMMFEKLKVQKKD